MIESLHGGLHGSLDRMTDLLLMRALLVNQKLVDGLEGTTHELILLIVVHLLPRRVDDLIVLQC